MSRAGLEPGSHVDNTQLADSSVITIRTFAAFMKRLRVVWDTRLEVLRELS